MKLIIDIPEERYKHIQEEQWLPNRLLIEKAIANGIPLDKIRAEIEQMDFDFGDFYDHTSTIREMVLEVIDRYRGDKNEANH